MDAAKNETLETIRSLWTCHGDFTDREIAEADLEAVLGAAVRAATASGQQSYSIIVVEDRATMKTLTGYAGSRALVFCADGNRLARAAERLGPGGPASGGASGAGASGGAEADMNAFVTWSADALLAAQNACIAARALGIDSLFTNGIGRTGADRAFALLGLPEKGCFPLITLVLGYAASRPDKRRGRLAGPGVVHRGRYAAQTDAELDAMIAAYDDPGAALGMTTAWVSKGYSHYLEWFFKDWMTGFPDTAGDEAARQLRTHGFLR